MNRKKLKKLLAYDQETGIFCWKVAIPHTRIKAGNQAGGIDHQGYCYLNIFGRRYLAHRLAWFYVLGRWPEFQIDHRNGIRSDNRWQNLREATIAQNAANRIAVLSKAGLRGVIPVGKRFVARIQQAKCKIYLGTFETAQAAHIAYRGAAHGAFGEFARYKN